jgi:hypothetical protein
MFDVQLFSFVGEGLIPSRAWELRIQFFYSSEAFTRMDAGGD